MAVTNLRYFVWGIRVKANVYFTLRICGYCVDSFGSPNYRVLLSLYPMRRKSEPNYDCGSCDCDNPHALKANIFHTPYRHLTEKKHRCTNKTKS